MVIRGESFKNMGRWKAKKIKRRGKPPANTPGRQKVKTCQSTPMDRFFAKRGRSYKHRDYGAWCVAHPLRTRNKR